MLKWRRLGRAGARRTAALVLPVLLCLLLLSRWAATHDDPDQAQSGNCGLSPPGNPCRAWTFAWVEKPQKGSTQTPPFVADGYSKLEATWGGGPPAQHKHVFIWHAEFKLWKPGDSTFVWIYDEQRPMEISQAHSSINQTVSGYETEVDPPWSGAAYARTISWPDGQPWLSALYAQHTHDFTANP